MTEEKIIVEETPKEEVVETPEEVVEVIPKEEVKVSEDVPMDEKVEEEVVLTPLQRINMYSHY